ncbi:hypothetical protein QFZ22_001901 [Streptomyces canus]|uniref:Uncharacterized protein n=1 Tax=Streptomyces canus TaxID=58343 RepID=A0AAW8F721_9ACTN|nr:hypothetical protein [Streptomyces canus]
MARPDHLDDSGGQVGLRVQAGREAVGVELVEEHGGAGHHGGRGVPLGGVGPEDDPQLTHDGGGVRVMALDVSDDGADAAAGQRDQVVPVAADVPAQRAFGAGGPVADGDIDAGDARDGARQHRLLEPGGEVLLLLVQHGPLEALGDAAAEGDQDVAILGGEPVPVAVQQTHRTDRTGLGDQREVGGGGDVEAGDVRPQDRVAIGELLRRLDEARGERAHGLAHRVRLVDPGDVGAGHEAARGALGDQPDPAGLDQTHDQAGGAEVGEAVGVLEDVDDVLDGPGMGESGRGELDDVGLLAPGLVLGDLLPVVLQLAHFLGGVADDADDPARAARPVPSDVALGVRPAQAAVTAAQAEVGAVVLAAVLDGLGDQGVEPVRLGPRHPDGEAHRVSVVLVGAQVEDLVGLGVHVEQTAVQVPVEAAHAVERQDRIRVGGPVVRE